MTNIYHVKVAVQMAMLVMAESEEDAKLAVQEAMTQWEDDYTTSSVDTQHGSTNLAGGSITTVQEVTLEEENIGDDDRVGPTDLV